MNLLTNSMQSASAAPNPNTASGKANIAAVEGAKAGAAADRKRRIESEESLSAVLASHDQGGRAVYWTRTIRADGERRNVLMVEREGAWGERQFLSACKSAARKAAKGSLRNDLAIEAIAAELCMSVLSRTGGRMPKRETLRQGISDDAYLATEARTIITHALQGDRRDFIGLASEIAPMAGSESDTVATTDLLNAAGDAAECADAYLCGVEIERLPERMPPVDEWTSAHWDWAEGRADQAAEPANEGTRVAAKRIAAECEARPSAVVAAILRTLRPLETAADMAAAGYGASGGAVRKSASLGRSILGRALENRPTTARLMTAADWRFAESLADLCAQENPAGSSRHPLEANGGGKVHAAGLLDTGFSGRPMLSQEPQGQGEMGAGSYRDASGALVYFSRDEQGRIAPYAHEG